MNNKQDTQVKQLLYSNDDNLEINWIGKDNEGFLRGIDSKEAISILLFDLTDSMKINNIYLLSQADYNNGKECSSCLIEDVNFKIDDNEYDTFLRCIHKDLDIKNPNVDSCYYLGKVNHNIPFKKVYNAYAFCVNDYIKSPKGFELDIPKGEINGKYYSLKKMKFSRVIKGECNDSLVLSSCMLLLSYLS
tara:strand:+ start:3430 stop:3999 length:570 start_codon:yes stop_codon:yes gene_type:complete